MYSVRKWKHRTGTYNSVQICCICYNLIHNCWLLLTVHILVNLWIPRFWVSISTVSNVNSSGVTLWSDLCTTIYKLCSLRTLESGDWRKQNHDLMPNRTAYALTRSFSHASHHCGHDSSPPIAVHTFGHGQAAMFLLYKWRLQVTPACITSTDIYNHITISHLQPL